MSRPITTRTGPHRAVLLLAVILGVLAMHHLATAMPAMPAMSQVATTVDHETVPTPPDDGGTGGHSGDQHMFGACLAVTTAGVVLLLVLMLIGVSTDSGDGRDRRGDVPVRVGRGPPFAPPTAKRLAALCLLRV